MSKRLINLFLIFILVLPFFAPMEKAEAANAYSVVMVSNTSNNETVGTYATYSEAVKAMNAQTSTSSKVASIYKNGTIINSKYAIFRLKPNNGTVNLYQNSGDWSAYTYTRPSSMTDTAFLDSNESRALIMLNGFYGWIDLDAGDIIPISLLGSNAVNITASGLRLRSEASTSSNVVANITCTNSIFTYTSKTTNGGYTWYKINYNGKEGWVASGSWLSETSSASLNTYYYRDSSGNLLHRYAYHNGTSYVDYFTNLGPTPTYLTEGVHYYSFDGGIYFYTTLTSMLDDYKQGSYARSINPNNPNFAYYLFLPNKSVSKVSAAELDSQITDTNSKLYGQGKYFKEAESLYGMNALSAFSTAKNESSNGTSKIAMDKNNVFGYGANDSCPYACAYSYNSVRDSIMDYAQKGLSSYMTASANNYFGTHAGNKGSGRNVKYASDPLWGETQAAIAYSTDLKVNKRDYLANTIGVTKYGKYNIPVYKEANDNAVIYKLQNKNSSFRVYNVSVTVSDKVDGYYKVFSDDSNYQYGYIKESDLYVSNNQPVINVSDKTVSLNSNFNVMDGVSASDNENGNLTNRVTVSGNVDTSKTGAYNVTYKVTDDSNFSVSKTVKITVQGSSEPIISADDKTISQYDDFDYMEGISAKDDTDGDITNKIVYDKTVDTSKAGVYNVTYKVTNSNGKTTEKTIKITVLENEKPVIEASDKVINLNSNFNALEGVKATDMEDGDITDALEVLENTVKVDTVGEYKVNYVISDKAGQSVTKTITVIVNEKLLKKVDCDFYLDFLKNIDGKLTISGYNTISDMEFDNLSFEIIFENQNDGRTYVQELEKLDIPTIPVYENSWFYGNIDVDVIPQGDYLVYVKTSSTDYYSLSIVQNMLLNEQITSYNTENKYVTISNNYFREDIPTEFMIRDTLVGVKETDFSTNQYNYIENIEMKNGIVNMRGASYSVGMDMGNDSSIKRTIIFENVNTFKTYSFDLGYLDRGSFDIELIAADKYGKVKNHAWYEKNIDLTSLEKGRYAIYVSNESNIKDFGEYNDLLFTDLSKAKCQYNDRIYEFSLNEKLRNRVELIIK
ncbi:MAG: DUF5011 domain-containing protein [Bacilli bacterium]|nr:DUF5011 domain-containing protein [Bacilli bacterium]